MGESRPWCSTHILGAAASSPEEPRLTGTITLRYLRLTRLGQLARGSRDYPK